MFRPEKGIEYFLRAAKLLAVKRPEVKFLLVGGAAPGRSSEYSDQIRALAGSLGLLERVVFTGPRTDIPDVMASIDVLVVPSLTEGFGRVIIEAGAVGTPVVGANVAAIPEVIEPGVTGMLVPPRDPEAIALAVDKLLQDTHLRERIREETPARVRRRFCPRTQVARLEAVLMSLFSQ